MKQKETFKKGIRYLGINACNISTSYNPVECSELGQERSLEPGDSMGHLKIKDLPELPVYPGAGGAAGAAGAAYPGAGGRRPQNTGYM